MIGCLLFALTLAPPELVTSDLAFGLHGEATAHGSCTASLVPAPETDGKLYSLKVTWRITERVNNDWLDVACNPVPPLDLSGTDSVRVWVRAAQPTNCVTIKLVDPDNPGANHSAYEGSLSANGQPLPADRWVPLDLKLPADPKLRDNLQYVGFYIACGNNAAPLNQDLVVYFGQFEYQLPPRPPWPPVPAGGRQDLTPVELDPLAPGGMWVLDTKGDRQTKAPGRYEDGAVCYDADAEGWNEFLHSDTKKLVLKPETSYRLQYDYTVLKEPSGGDSAQFYQLVRASGTIQKDVGWSRWTGPAGSGGRRLITFTTLDMPDYFLIFGIRHQGAIRIENIRLQQVGQGGAQ